MKRNLSFDCLDGRLLLSVAAQAPPKGPSTPQPIVPTSPPVPPGDGTPPIAGPSVPGGTTEPA